MGGRSRISPLKARNRRLSFPVLTAFKALSLIYLRFKVDVVGDGITGIKSFRTFYRGAIVFCEGRVTVFQVWGELPAHEMQSPMGIGNSCRRALGPPCAKPADHREQRKSAPIILCAEQPCDLCWGQVRYRHETAPPGFWPSLDRPRWGRTGLFPHAYPQSCS